MRQPRLLIEMLEKHLINPTSSALGKWKLFNLTRILKPTCSRHISLELLFIQIYEEKLFFHRTVGEKKREIERDRRVVGGRGGGYPASFH